MQHLSIYRIHSCLLSLALAAVSLFPTAAIEGDERVYLLRPSANSEMAISHIGATGIRARIHHGMVVKVESVIPACQRMWIGC